MAKYLGKINPVDRNAGKGDRVRPRIKYYNMDLFLDISEARKFEKKHKDVCYICKGKLRTYTIIYYQQKKLVVCDRCKVKIYK